MFITRALLAAVAASLAISPVLAQSVTVTFNPGQMSSQYSVSVFNVQQFQGEMLDGQQTLNYVYSTLDYDDGGNFVGTPRGNLQVGDVFSVNAMNVGNVEIGRYRIDYDGGEYSLTCISGNADLDKNFSWSADANGNFSVDFVTSKFTVDVGGYQGGYRFPNVYGDVDLGKFTGDAELYLPLVFANARIMVGRQNTFFNRDAEGWVTQNFDLSTSKITLVEVQDGFVVSPENVVTFSWECPGLTGDFAIAFGEGNGGGGGETGTGELLRGEVGTYTLLTGLYYAALVNANGTRIGGTVWDQFAMPVDFEAAVAAGTWWVNDDGYFETIVELFPLSGAGYNGDPLTMRIWIGPVPEPATMSLLALGGLALLRRKR